MRPRRAGRTGRWMDGASAGPRARDRESEQAIARGRGDKRSGARGGPHDRDSRSFDSAPKAPAHGEYVLGASLRMTRWWVAQLFDRPGCIQEGRPRSPTAVSWGFLLSLRRLQPLSKGADPAARTSARASRRYILPSLTNPSTRHRLSAGHSHSIDPEQAR